MGREGGPSEEQPIVSKWRQASEISTELLGKGFESQVHRHTFDTPEGTQGYALKNVDPARGGFNERTYDIYEADAEAGRVLDIYHRLKSAGLPVISFMKSIHTKDESGARITQVAMEDITEGGKYSIAENYRAEGKLAFEKASAPVDLARQMVEALAVIHNNGLYHFHVGVSFFLKTDLSEPGKSELVILDYANFTDTNNPYGPAGGNKKESGFDFETACEENLDFLLSTFTQYFSADLMRKLKDHYMKFRESGIQQYA